MQRPRGQEVLRGLDGYERMVDTFAQNAKAYWGSWGPLGEPMVRGVEAWAQMQRTYLQWLRQTPGARASTSSRDSRYQEGDSTTEERSAGEVAQELAEEAHRIAIEAQREAAREEAEGSADKAHRSPEREVRGAIRESVRRSEEATGRGRPRAEAGAPKEDQADAEGLPLEDYDSLSVNRVTQKLGELSVEEIERLRDYEAENKGRRSLIERFDRRIRAARDRPKEYRGDRGGS
jgi:hypothetical protein